MTEKRAAIWLLGIAGKYKWNIVLLVLLQAIANGGAVCYALVEVLTDGNKVTEYNALGFGDDLNDADRATIKTAIEKHMAAHKEISKITYQALASVFNVEIK